MDRLCKNTITCFFYNRSIINKSKKQHRNYNPIQHSISAKICTLRLIRNYSVCSTTEIIMPIQQNSVQPRQRSCSWELFISNKKYQRRCTKLKSTTSEIFCIPFGFVFISATNDMLTKLNSTESSDCISCVRTSDTRYT